MTEINPDSKEFVPDLDVYKPAPLMEVKFMYSPVSSEQYSNNRGPRNDIRGYSYTIGQNRRYMKLSKPAGTLLSKNLGMFPGDIHQDLQSIPHQFGEPGFPAAIICRNDIAPGKYVEAIDNQHFTFGQYVTYNKDKRFVCAEGIRYIISGYAYNKMIIIANYIQGIPTEVSAYTYNESNDKKGMMSRIFHQVYDNYGYPKLLTMRYNTVTMLFSTDKVKFSGVYSVYLNNILVRWFMLDGKSPEDIDGLKIDSSYGNMYNSSNISIKVGYYIRGEEVAPQQYIDHIKSITFKGILGDSKQPQIESLILQYSNISQIRDNLVEAKKVLAPYNTQTNVIEALQVIDTVVKLLQI